MRIAYISADPGVHVFGHKGCSVHVQEVVGALRRLGLTVDLFAASCEGIAPPELETVRVHRLPFLPKGEFAAREQAALAANYDLRVALEREGPFDLVYERYSLWSYEGMEYAHAMGVSGLLEVNAPLIEEQATYRGLAHRRVARQVAERAFGTASALIAVSEEVGEYLESYPEARGHVHVVPNGVNTHRFQTGIEPSCPGPPGAFTVGFVGSLKPWHGLPILAQAFAVLHHLDQSTRLLIVGDGTERANIEADLIRYGLIEAAHFTGAVPPSEVPGLLASMDVAVAPYPDLSDCYFSPLKLFEYMAAGLPIVASRVGQVARVVQDGINGLLCPAGDAVALALAIQRIRSEPGLGSRLGRAARATVLVHHTWDAVAEHILRLAGFELASQPFSSTVRR